MKEIHKAYKFRIYPTKEQAEFIDEQCRASAVIYNYFLWKRKMAYEATQETLSKPKVAEVKDGKEIWERDDKGKVVYEQQSNPTYSPEAKTMSRFDCNHEITRMKNEEESWAWLNNISSNALLYAMIHLDAAYQNFYRGRKKGQNVGYPRRKDVDDNLSYSDKFKLCKIAGTTQRGKSKLSVAQDLIEDNYVNPDNPDDKKYREYYLLYLPYPRQLKKVKPISQAVRIKMHTPVLGHIQSGTISKTPSGQYYVSLTCDQVPYESVSTGTDEPIGIDLGIEPFAMLSNFNMVDGIKYLAKAERRLKYQQQVLSYKQRGSKNYEKQRLKVAKLHQHVANQRANFLHNLSKKLVDNYQIIGVKQGLGEKDEITDVNKASSDASFFEFVRQLQYKADWADQLVVEVDKKFAANNICSECGGLIESDASNKEIVCPHCGKILNARLNAAINIKNETVRKLEN